MISAPSGAHPFQPCLRSRWTGMTSGQTDLKPGSSTGPLIPSFSLLCPRRGKHTLTLFYTPLLAESFPKCHGTCPFLEPGSYLPLPHPLEEARCEFSFLSSVPISTTQGCHKNQMLLCSNSPVSCDHTSSVFLISLFLQG